MNLFNALFTKVSLKIHVYYTITIITSCHNERSSKRLQELVKLCIVYARFIIWVMILNMCRALQKHVFRHMGQ